MYHSVEIIFKKPTICKHRHWNLGIGIGIGTITTSAISSIRPMDTRPSRVILRMRGSQPQNHVTLRYRGNVTDKKHYISTFTKPMDPKLSRVVTQDERTSPTKSRDISTTWSREKSKTLYIHFHKAYGPQTQQGGDLG